MKETAPSIIDGIYCSIVAYEKEHTPFNHERLIALYEGLRFSPAYRNNLLYRDATKDLEDVLGFKRAGTRSRKTAELCNPNPRPHFPDGVEGPRGLLK
jgi:hypothetical protein